MPTIKKPLTIGDILKSEADPLSRVAITARAGTKAGTPVLYTHRGQHLIALTDEQHGKVLVQPHNCVMNLDVISEADITAIQEGSPAKAITVDAFVKQGDTFGIKYIGTPYASASTAPTAPAATLTINTIAGDGVINATEDDTDVTISGTATNVPNATAISVTVNSKTYTGTVTNNAWTVTMPAVDAQALPESVAQTVTAMVTVNGNAITATSTVTHQTVA